MEIQCSACHARYQVKDDLLPAGRTLRLACKACKAPITIGAATPSAGSGAPSSESPGDLWKHSLAVAVGSKILAQMRAPGLSSAAHTAGLIHDIGKIILDPYVHERRQPIETYMEEHQKTFLDAEIEHFGFSHAEVAAYVCSAWKFPELITKAIHWHHNPVGSSGDLLAAILHLADHLALMGGAGYDDDDALSEVQKEAVSQLNLKQADLSEIVFKLLESVNQVQTG